MACAVRRGFLLSLLALVEVVVVLVLIDCNFKVADVFRDTINTRATWEGRVIAIFRPSKLHVTCGPMGHARLGSAQRKQ